MQANPGRFAYQVFFHTDEARVLLDSNVERVVRSIMRASTDEPVAGEDLEFQSQMYGLEKVTGITKPSSPTATVSPPSSMLTQEDMQVYVSQFTQCGFLNPIRWYRNVENNWKWNQNIKGKKVTMPSLMVTAENDHILTPSMTKGMDAHCTQLTIVHVKESSHWIMQQQPQECARVMCEWLQKLPIQSATAKL